MVVPTILLGVFNSPIVAKYMPLERNMQNDEAMTIVIIRCKKALLVGKTSNSRNAIVFAMADICSTRVGDLIGDFIVIKLPQGAENVLKTWLLSMLTKVAMTIVIPKQSIR